MRNFKVRHLDRRGVKIDTSLCPRRTEPQVRRGILIERCTRALIKFLHPLDNIDFLSVRRKFNSIASLRPTPSFRLPVRPYSSKTRVENLQVTHQQASHSALDQSRTSVSLSGLLPRRELPAALCLGGGAVERDRETRKGKRGRKGAGSTDGEGKRKRKRKMTKVWQRERETEGKWWG